MDFTTVNYSKEHKDWVHSFTDSQGQRLHVEERTWHSDIREAAEVSPTFV